MTKTQQQLADCKAIAEKVITEKNNAIKRLLSLQYELDEARADMEIYPIALFKELMG